MIKKLLNKLGYFKLTQIKIGGMCGLCGKKIQNHIWVDLNDNFDDIGICEGCIKEAQHDKQ